MENINLEVNSLIWLKFIYTRQVLWIKPVNQTIILTFIIKYKFHFYALVKIYFATNNEQKIFKSLEK